MTRTFRIYKNIPLRLILKKDLRRIGISQKDLAGKIGMSYYSLNKALNTRRLFTLEEAEKIDRFFDYEPGFVKNMQAHHLHNKKSPSTSTPILPPPYIRACVFWDIDFKALDWISHRQFILKRVNSYGNASEKSSVRDYYAKLSLNEKL